ncbi:H/ACA ribonucleoprotein complex non-core subunit NAF1 [Leptidea sinapis]|uniref:H/ACA ribonucleoprotein complex non-core subunit NAF1 n=1 Tax=Leptidea sinapis TaxID=189913 RepID=UPI002131F925|nr:H/ACA ribonucleoprotein complex non-core subunit NAF1 [Leptidea sinapis]
MDDKIRKKFTVQAVKLIADYGSDSDFDNTPPNEKTDENNMEEESDSVELSEMVLKHNIINACAHGPLSEPSNNEEVTRHMIIDSSQNSVTEYDVTSYREDDKSESDSDSDSSDDSSDIVGVKCVDDLSSGDEGGDTNPSKIVPPKVQGELGLDDLPPIEDLTISLPAQETTNIGKVLNIIDRLVIVQAFPGTSAVDIDTILFLENGAKALGKVFDVFGPVREPHYCVRFNSPEHIVGRGIEIGMEVCIAPRTSHTNYVFVNELMRSKGSDASWLNDVEPPPGHIEYSDDEEERRARKEKKQSRQHADNHDKGEASNNPQRKIIEPRRNRPVQQFSRFGATSRPCNAPFRVATPLLSNMLHQEYDNSIPPPHLMAPRFSVPPGFSAPMHNAFRMPRHQFGRMAPMPPPNMPNFGQNMSVFGAANFWNYGGPFGQMIYRPPPPPPGT